MLPQKSVFSFTEHISDHGEWSKSILYAVFSRIQRGSSGPSRKLEPRAILIPVGVEDLVSAIQPVAQLVELVLWSTKSRVQVLAGITEMASQRNVTGGVARRKAHDPFTLQTFTLHISSPSSISVREVSAGTLLRASDT